MLRERGGFTLVELVLAIGLFSVVAIAAMDWLAATQRRGLALRERLERSEVLVRVVNVLRDDLAQLPTAVELVVRPDGLGASTHAPPLPGDPASGSYAVRIEGDGLIVRVSGDGRRPLAMLPGAAFERGEDGVFLRCGAARWFLAVGPGGVH